MRDTALGSADLPVALEATLRDMTAGSGIEVAMVTTGDRRRLERSVEIAAFRIGREAIANAVRHADARRIEIHLAFRAIGLRLEVCDDGRGFSAEQAEEAHRRGHFGLSGMRERAVRMGGTCDVKPRSGGGTVVSLELPLWETRAHHEKS
jgi:signal transduction histidine kinase